LGDSIALGTGHALGIPTTARSGAGSCKIMSWVTRRHFDHVVLSAGINDNGKCVAALRARIHAEHVIEIIPADINHAAFAVWNSVKVYGDKYVVYECPGARCTRKNFHPASYQELAAAVRRVW
jgi:hypothetical protein